MNTTTTPDNADPTLSDAQAQAAEPPQTPPDYEGGQIDQGGNTRTTIEFDVPPPFGEDEFKLLARGYHSVSAIDAMQIEGVGCIVRSAMSIVFVPNVKIKDVHDEAGELIGRKLIQR